MDMAGYIGHRGDYHQAFIDRVTELGITINMGSEIVSFDESVPSATLKSGETITADVIIGADGKHSTFQKKIDDLLEPQASNRLAESVRPSIAR